MADPSDDAPPPSRSPNTVLAVVGLLLLAALTLGPNGATLMNTWPWWAAQRLLWVLPAITALVAMVTRKRSADESRARLTTAAIALIVAAAAVPVLSALLSTHPRESLGAAIAPAGGALLILSLVHGLKTQQDRRRLARIVVAGAALFCVASLVQWLLTGALPAWATIQHLNATAGEDVFHLNPHGFRNDRPLGHSSYTAGVAILGLPWLVVTAWRARGARRAGWSFVALAGLLVLLSTGSRGAFVGLAAGGAYAVVHIAVAARWSFGRVVAAGAVLVAALGILVLAVPRARHAVVALATGDALNTGDRQRMAMMQIGWDMGAERWWIGQGPGLATRFYPYYRERVDGGVDAALQLHSTPVQLWAETGLPGLVLAGALLLVPLLAGLREVRRTQRPDATDQPKWPLAAAVSLAGYAGFALTDHQLDIPVVVAALAANLVFLLPRTPRVFGKGTRHLGAAATALAVVAMVVLSWPELRARRAFALGMDALERGNDQAAFDEQVVEATRLQPDNPYYLAGGGATHLRLSQTATEPAIRAKHLAIARAFLEQALDIEPGLEFAHFNLGWLLLESDPGKACEHFRSAQRLLADEGGVYLGLGLARLHTGDLDRACDAIALEVLDDPIFVTAPIWDTPLLAPHRDAIFERAIAIAREFEDAAGPETAPRIAYVRHLLRWLRGDDAASADAAQVATGEARAFFEAVAHPAPASEPEHIVPGTPGWRVLRDAMARPQGRRDRLARFLFVRTRRPADPAQLEVLERAIERIGPDWRAWVLAPEGREAPFVRTYRRDRVSFPILARNLDIPAPHDAYVVQDNQLALWFFDFVFPARGHLPDALLLSHVARRDL